MVQGRAHDRRRPFQPETVACVGDDFQTHVVASDELNAQRGGFAGWGG